MADRLPYRRSRQRRPGRRRWRWRPARWARDLIVGLALLALIDIAQLVHSPTPAGGFQGAAPARAQESIRLRVIDGDTVEIRGTGERVRLGNIDAPETGGRERCTAERQAGERATREARRLVNGADRVDVRRTGREDQYGRTIGFVSVDGRDLGGLLISAGLARPWRGRREPWCSATGELLR